MSRSQALGRKLRFGQIGGGLGSFIGDVHRRVATFDNTVECVAGALSSTPERAQESGRAAGLPADRTYDSWQQMLETEKNKPDEERLDFVCIVTPNHVHYEPALAFAESGFNVIIDKPLVHTSEQAQNLIKTVEAQEITFGVTYNYTGYPMVKEARHWVRSGKLGDLRRVVVEYPQGWLREKLEAQNHKQAAWRTDPKRTGIAGAVGDIGTHAENLAYYVTGLKLKSLCADVSTFVDGRLVDDDASVLMRYEGGVKGVLWVSQVAAGEGQGLNIRVYGTEAGLYWNQETPNELRFMPGSGAVEIHVRGSDYLCSAAQRAASLPGGLGEAYYEAFANIYRNYCDTIRARLLGDAPDELELDFPTVYDGAQGVRFMEKVIESGSSDAKWVSFE